MPYERVGTQLISTLTEYYEGKCVITSIHGPHLMSQAASGGGGESFSKFPVRGEHEILSETIVRKYYCPGVDTK